jgi:hypothetical protein
LDGWGNVQAYCACFVPVAKFFFCSHPAVGGCGAAADAAKVDRRANLLETEMRSKRLSAVAGMILLAGCNANRQPEPVVDPVGPQRPPVAALPEGTGCAASVGRYRAVIENDLAMGHVNQNVYAQIQSELGEASSACAAGQDAKAIGLVRASKARHGYPGN